MHFIHLPQDLGVNLKADAVPHKCFIPKRQIHTWAGHKKGVSVIRWLPGSAHLIMSGSMDATVKLYEVYGKKRLLRTFSGHKQAIRDVNFNNSGDRFLSASYDRYIKMWDTETGQVVGRFSNKKMAFCAKFNPNDALQHLIVAGTSSNKIVCWDSRSGDIVQEYDRHLAAVNTITFVDRNRRFISTSDDKSLRVWEWNIPVDMKYIADPSMHSMPAVTASPNGKFVACQSLDNKIVIYQVGDRFKELRKKVFKGHMVAGYACGLDFSPEMSYLASGDGDGKCYIWDWKTTKLLSKWKAHDDVCIQVHVGECLSSSISSPPSRCCGTLTRRARWLRPAGTGSSSSGTKSSPLRPLGRGLFFYHGFKVFCGRHVDAPEVPLNPVILEVNFPDIDRTAWREDGSQSY